MVRRIASLFALASLLAFAAPVLAAEDPVEARINQLHERLRVSGAQAEQWNAIAAIMRANAKQISDLVADKQARDKTMTAIDDLRAYEEIAATHAQGVKRLAEAFEPFYAGMTAEQKKVADDVFRDHKKKAR
jgi:hypothetical protein